MPSEMEREERDETPDQSVGTPQDGAPVLVVTKREKKKRKLHHLLFIILLWVIGCLAAGGLAILLFIQLPIAKRLVVNELVKTIESSTNGTLTIGAVEGNLLQGFILKDVHLNLRTWTKYEMNVLQDKSLKKISFDRADRQ